MARDPLGGARAPANQSSPSKTLPSQVGAADRDATLDVASTSAGDVQGSEAMNMHSSIKVAPSTTANSSPLTDAWEIALADYQSKRAFSEAMPMGAEGEDEAVDEFCAAMDHLIVNIPALYVDQLLIKIDLALERADGFCGIFPFFATALAEDLKRFTTPLAPFAFAWLQNWTYLGGSVTPQPSSEGGVWIGVPTYDRSPVAADFELLANAARQLNCPGEVTGATFDRHRARDEARYDGGSRQLMTLLEDVPGGVDAVKAIIEVAPKLGLARVVEI